MFESLQNMIYIFQYNLVEKRLVKYIQFDLVPAPINHMSKLTYKSQRYSKNMDGKK